MKKIFLCSALFAALAITSNASSACNINSVRSKDVSTMLKKYNGYEIAPAVYDKLCNKLRRANAKIVIAADAIVLNNQSIGYAYLTLMDNDLPIATPDFASSNVAVDSYASQTKANDLMYQAIISAMSGWDVIDSAIVSLDEERAKIETRKKK